jgi:hypothetical protein
MYARDATSHALVICALLEHTTTKELLRRNVLATAFQAATPSKLVAYAERSGNESSRIVDYPQEGDSLALRCGAV